MLDQQAALTDGDDRSGTSATPRGQGRLPAPRTRLIGRDAEVAEAADLLGRWRLVALVGPGGVGKTRLGIGVARKLSDRFSGGVFFADLGPVSGSEELVAAVAAAVGVRLVGERSDLEPVVAARLRRDPSLLVLDNCEHVADATARLVDRLLDAAEPLRVLVTSRRPLEVGGEQVQPVAPLDVEAASALFVERADARRPGAGSNAPEDAVRQICDRLDRLPLAVELAAARVGDLSVAEIAEDVAEHPERLGRVLGDGSDPRHGSLAATIRWSYELLEADARAVLRRLAVFRGSFDREQAAAVGGGGVPRDRIGETLAELVGQSLVVAEPGATATTYRLLDTVRAFLRTELDAVGESADALRAHRDWYLGWARELPRGATVIDMTRALSLQRHHADLLQALEHARRAGSEALADLALLAAGLAFCPGGLPDAGRWLDRARQHVDELADGKAADLLAAAMLVAMLRYDWDDALGLLRRTIQLLDADVTGIGPLALALGMASPDTAAEAKEATDRLLARQADEIGPEVLHTVRAMRPTATLTATRDVEQALEPADHGSG